MTATMRIKCIVIHKILEWPVNFNFLRFIVKLLFKNQDKKSFV